MDNVYLVIGQFFCGLGGSLLMVALIGFIVDLACMAWIEASNKFRAICRAESMIFEYQKHRNDFMYWLHMQKGEGDGT